jgi:hypothetical protein
MISFNRLQFENKLCATADSEAYQLLFEVQPISWLFGTVSYKLST